MCVGAAGVEGADVRKPLIQGAPPPEFSLPDTTGRTVHLSDFKGRVILVSFVSCYTDTCFASVNALEDLLARLGSTRIAALTICTEVPDALKQNRYAGLLKRCGVGQRILIDETQAASIRYFVTEFPTSVLIGPDFAVREVVTGSGALRDPEVRARIEKLANLVAPRTQEP